MRRIVLPFMGVLAAGCLPAARSAPTPPTTAETDAPVEKRPPVALPVRAGQRPIDVAIEQAVEAEREAADWPRPAAEREPTPRASKVETLLGKKICSGKPGPKERPHRAACCYPDKVLIVRPLRAAFPALRACYDRRTNRDAAGRVVLQFRIEEDGTIAHACATETTSMLDEDAARCMVEEVRKLRYPAVTAAEVDLCGLMTLAYPVVLEP